MPVIVFNNKLGCGSKQQVSFICELFIFPSIYDEKIQWSTSGIENVADFFHFVT